MIVIRKRILITISILIALAIGGVGMMYTKDKDAQADSKEQTNPKTENKDIKVDKKEKEKANPIDDYTDDELKELIIKGRKANKGEIELSDITEEELTIMKSIPPKKHYDLMGMTDENVLGYIDGLHNQINILILEHYEGTERTDIEFLPNTPAFEWINENHNFENEKHNKTINKIVELMQEYKKNKDEDIIFTLKPILYELNKELNPGSLKERRATELTLRDAERIKEGKEPIDKEGEF